MREANTVDIKDDFDQLINVNRRRFEEEDQAEEDEWAASKRWRDELRPGACNVEHTLCH